MAAYGFAGFRRMMPGYDCGLCGNATCATFARRLLLGANSLTDCPILQREGYSENRSRIEEMLKKGVVHSSPSIITVPGFKTKYAHPNYFEERCEKLPTRFLDYDTSRHLISLLWKPEWVNGDGVEVIDTFFGNLRFLVTTSGRIAVNIGEKRTEERELVSILYKVLWGAVVCPRNGCTLLEYVGGCCLDYKPPPGPYLTRAPFLQRGPSRSLQEKPDLILPSLSKIFEEATKEEYENYFSQINEILMGIGMVTEGLGSNQSSNIAMLNSKHNQLMGELVKNIASVSIEEASRLVVLAGICLNIKRVVEAMDALSFLFEGREDPIEAQRKNVKEAVEILVKAFSSLRPKREKELDDVLSRFKFLRITMGGVERIANKTISILVYKIAYNGYCTARVARGSV